MNTRISRTLFAAVFSAVLLVAAGTASAAVPAGNTGWNWANPLPQGGSLYRVAEAGGRVWIGGASGTLMYSDDGGVGWSGVRTGLLDGIRTVIPLGRDSVVFAGSCALRRTDDAGATIRRLPWAVSDDSCPTKIQSVSFSDGQNGHLMLANGELFVTTDGGSSWSRQNPVPGSTVVGGEPVYELHFGSQTGVVSVGSRLLFSTDGGASWADSGAPVSGGGKFVFSFVDEQLGFAAGDRTGLLKTVDGGRTWAAVDSAISGVVSVSSLSCRDQLSCVATPRAAGGVLATVDGGATWINPLLTIGDASAVAMVGGARVVAVGAGGRLAVSTDAGVSWLGLGSNITGGMTSLRSAGKLSALVFGAGGLARTSDGGASWNQLVLPPGGELLDAAMPSAQRLLVLRKPNVLLKSVDGGGVWRPFTLAAGFKPRSMVVFRDGRALITGSRGILVARGWGARTAQATGVVGALSLSSADPAGRSAFFYSKRLIVTTADRGRTFSRVRLPRGAAAIVQLEMLDARTGYLLDANAELFATRNGGRHWKRIETTGANQATAIAFGDRKHGYITDATGRVLMTEDAGATWSRQYPFFDPDGKSPVSVIGLSKLGAIALSRSTGSLYATSSAGRIGRPSVLTIKPSAKRVRRGTVVPVTGRLAPATGVERVAVLARVTGARGGTEWVTQNVTVSANGTFTTRWKISAPTELIARWSGDASHDGDAAPLRIIRLRR